MEGRDVAGGAEIRKRVKRTFLEFCCSPMSLLCDPQFTDGHTRLVRLIEKEDMTTKGGLEYALDYAQRSDAGCITLFGALPCTWGASWQYLHEHLRGSDPKHRQHMDELYGQFTRLLHNFVLLARVANARGGYIVFEWPDCGKNPRHWQWKRSSRCSVFDSVAAQWALRALKGLPFTSPGLFPQIAQRLSLALPITAVTGDMCI